MGGRSAPPAPPPPAPAPAPVDITPQRTAAEQAAAAKRAGQRRSSLISSVATPDTLGSGESLGTGGGY